MINIEVLETFSQSIEQDLLTKAAEAALIHQKAPASADLTIAIEDDEMLHQLNLQYRGIDKPADVLSFAAAETDPETGNVYLGDIVISFPRAKTQAAAAGHPVDAEIQLLVVHGILHLLGNDHAEEIDKLRMWTAQKEILTMINCPLKAFPD